MPDEMAPYSVLLESYKKMVADGLDETVILPAFVNVAAMLAVKFGGESLLREAVIIMAHRLKDYRDGIMPPRASPLGEPPEPATCGSCERTVREPMSKRGMCIGCEELARLAEQPRHGSQPPSHSALNLSDEQGEG